MKYLTPTDEYWVVDIEADSLTPTKIWVCVARNVIKPDKIEVFTKPEQFNEWYNADPKVLIGHNLLSFDAKPLNKLWGANIKYDDCIDTLVLSYLYNPVMEGGHSLAAWGERLKCPKSDFDDWSKYTDEMKDYCIQDTLVTVKLYHALTKRMKLYGWSEDSCRIEHDFRVIIDEQQDNGFPFDVIGAGKLYRSLRQQGEALAETIRQKFPPVLVSAGVMTARYKADGELNAVTQRILNNPDYTIKWLDDTTYERFVYQEFNIGSPKQRVDRLLALGWQPEKFTEKGFPQVNEESLTDFANASGIEEVKMIADWLVLTGRANMINTWLENLSPDGKIHGRVNSCGAGTRRCTHNSPNTANVPSVQATYGYESRALWVAGPGRVVVGIDASGLEGRVFIHYLGSKEAEEFMVNDPHTANARAVGGALGKDVDNWTPEEAKVWRQLAKNLFYARLYGASDKKLGAMVHGTPAMGTLVREAIDQNIPGFAALVEKIAAEWKKNDTRIQTIDGGYVWCPSPHASINYKFQSCGAIIMKVAAKIHKDLMDEENLDYRKVGDIHDEWQYSVSPKHAERVGELGCIAIRLAGEALKMNISLDGEYKIGYNWAETH